MEQLLTCAVLAFIGLCMGSFAGASVWRLRARQLVQDKAAGEDVGKREYDQLLPLTKATVVTDHSRCLHCGHTLKWYDLIPLVSWLSTKGRCRYCHAKIGRFEPLIELGLAVFFVGSYLLWPDMLTTPLHVAHFILWLVAGVMLAILFVYDLKWFLLPDFIIFPLIAVGAGVAVLQVVGAYDMGAALINLLIAAVTLSGLYLLLWVISKGQWIGFGDVKLGLGLALLLADWRLAFITLFAANLVGSLFVIPGMLAGKITRKSRVPFGPLLILGSVIAMLGGHYIIAWYFTSFI